DVFDTEVFRSWEFNSTYPIRSIAFPYIFCGIPFFLLKAVSIVFSVHRLHPYFLLVLPRLAITAFTLLIDVYLKKLCILFGREFRPVLYLFSTSYVTLTYLTRTLSNSIETVLFAALLFYVSKSITEITNAAEKTKSVVNPHSITISCLTVAGIFNRPTFLFFAFTPLMFWIQFGPNQTLIRKIRYRVNSLLPGVFLTGFMFATCDTAYYKGIPISSSEIFTRDILQNLVLTPWNFIKYNFDVKNLAEHGLHPFWLHSLINIPILFGYLGIIGYVKYWKLLFEILFVGMLRINIIRALFSCSFVFPLLLLSLFEHQEPRFLIPVIFPLVYLHGSKIWGKKGSSISRSVWLTYNASGLFFYGFFHQSGIVRCALGVASKLLFDTFSCNEVTLIFFHTYMVPRHLFNIGVHRYIIDLGSANFTVLKEELTQVYQIDENARVYSIMPATVSKLIPDSFAQSYNFSLVTQYGPHFSSEDLATFDYSNKNANWIQLLCNFCSLLYLDVWELSVNK
uniref:Mannosyltransferase n=1 Tax=Strigamia maritima TaxID=126957 RepID=T1IZS6_STRMM